MALVGRDRELATLEALLVEARDGRGSLAVLLGEPGIGKTRIAEELAASARRSGFGVLWTSCLEGETRPFAPWADLGAQAVASSTGSDLSRRLGSNAPAAAALVPALGAALPDLPAVAALSPADARFRLYEALSRLVLPDPGAPPTLVVLDDLHWADTQSLELLAYVGRTLAAGRIVVVGTARQAELTLTHPLSHALADLDRALPVARVRLSGLGEVAVAGLLEEMLGRPAATAAVGTVVTKTGGNPFFVVALARHFVDEGHDLTVGAPLASAIPASVRDAVGRRLAHLAEDTARLLNVACAFTGPFGFEALQAVIGIAEEPLLAAVDEAIAAAMLRPVGEERYEFAHALVRQTLYDSLSPSRRSRLHRRVAQALEQVYATAAEAHGAELAAQYHLSRSLPGAAHGLQYALAAAAGARRRFAFERAAEMLRFACDLAEEGAPPVRAAILTQLAVAEAEALHVEAALQTVADALWALDEAGSAPDEVAGFLAEAAWALEDAGTPRESVQPLVARGLALVNDRRDLTWARLKLAESPLESFTVGDVRAGRWLGFDDDAVAIARAAGSERDYAKTVELMDWRTRTETDELLETARSWNDPAARIHVLGVIVRSLMHRHGAFREGGEVAAELASTSERYGSLPGQAYALLYLGLAAHHRGDTAVARHLVEEAEEIVRRLGPAHRLHFSVRFVEHTLLQVGDSDWLAIAELRSQSAGDPALPPWMAVLHVSLAARAYAEAGEVATTRTLLADLVPALARLDPRTLNQNGAVAGAARAVWLLRIREHAATLRRLALDLIAAGVCDYGGTSLELSVAWMAALDDDHGRALEYLERARTTLAASGQRAVVDLVDAAERDLRGRGARPDGLTVREVEILRAVAAGQSNRQIASSLFLSVHTVERHVANAYRKIGAHNRAEAAAYVTRRELT